MRQYKFKENSIVQNFLTVEEFEHFDDTSKTIKCRKEIRMNW